MSSFACEKCGKNCHDTEVGYITGCEHYPADEKAIMWFVKNFYKIKRRHEELVKEIRRQDTEFGFFDISTLKAYENELSNWFKST